MTETMGPTDVLALDGYASAELVGRGGSSVVFRADQTRFDRTVAVKVVQGTALDDAGREAFTRECATAGRVSRHPNIVTVLDGGTTAEGQAYLVTEFMVGGSLADRIENGERLSVTETLDLGVKLCGALATVHAAGILHRDVKPENILYSDYRQPQLADFGISALRDTQASSSDAVALTPSHAAPELWNAGPVTPVTDIYALGSTLFMALTGRAPFDDGDLEIGELVRRTLHEERAGLPVETGPESLDAVLGRALARDPHDRFPDAVSFARALQAEQTAMGLRRTPLVVPAELDVAREDDDELLAPVIVQGLRGLWLRRVLWTIAALAMLLLGLSVGRAVQTRGEAPTGEARTGSAAGPGETGDPTTTAAGATTVANTASAGGGNPPQTTTSRGTTAPTAPPAPRLTADPEGGTSVPASAGRVTVEVTNVSDTSADFFLEGKGGLSGTCPGPLARGETKLCTFSVPLVTFGPTVSGHLDGQGYAISVLIGTGLLS